MEKAARGYRILGDGRVVLVVEVLVESQYSVLSEMGEHVHPFLTVRCIDFLPTPLPTTMHTTCV